MPGTLFISGLTLAAAATFAAAQSLAVSFRNVAALPATATDQHGQPFTITGLSGITQESPGGSTYWAVLDNSNKLIRLNISIASNGAITSATVLSGLSLSASHDFEGIAMRSGPIFHLAEESTPALRSGSLPDGGLFTVSPTPAVYSNLRPNFGFESLTITPPGFSSNSYLWTANEEALTVDGDASSQAAGTVVRLCRFTLGAGQIIPGPQYAYRTEPWHGSSITGARSGVCDLVALPDGRMLILERSFAFNLAGFFQTRIYEADFAGATDVSSLTGLIGQSYSIVGKRLLYQGDQQNLEGLALGPMIGAGRYALIGIVDDGDPISVNRVVGFELSGVGPPECYVNCDQSNAPPVLTANDFLCYLNAYSAGESYANCDGSPGAQPLNPNDFQCFLNRYAAGCD